MYGHKEITVNSRRIYVSNEREFSGTYSPPKIVV